MKSLNKNLIKETQGHGLIGAIIFKDYKKYPSKKIADIFSQLCTDKGLLICNTGRESVKLGPPLIINKKGLLKSINILFECLGNLKRSI
jgi:acetylornithine/succinyldiaminopimelate/putrescine aminotransferase